MERMKAESRYELQKRGVAGWVRVALGSSVPGQHGSEQ